MRLRTLIVGLGVLVAAVIGVAVFHARQNSARQNFHAPITTSPNPGDAKVNSKDGLSYIWIPPGTFQMGCLPQNVVAGEANENECENYEQPAHTATITKGFWMGQTEVTQAAYQRVRGTNPSNFHGDPLPVEQVSWDDANAYCGRVGMRLPTEAEWEYAARAGSSADRYGDPDDIGWHGANSDHQTHEVGQKQPNAWKLHDMLGNVWEWVGDWYDANYYSQSPPQDPRGPSSGKYRVLRGGSANDLPLSMRASYRFKIDPGVGLYYFAGFRCVGE
jgi:formylglycine-generating enzyme required for sulfatase activity